jgi:hypothetical protein
MSVILHKFIHNDIVIEAAADTWVQNFFCSAFFR